MAAAKKSRSDWIPAALMVLAFAAVIVYPMVRDKFLAPLEMKVVEYKDRIVEKEKIVEKEIAPTVSINSLRIMVQEVVDGNTIIGDIDLPLDVRLVNQTIRCVGYDTYGLTELKGLDAKNELTSLLSEDVSVFGMTTEQSRDSDGNILLTVYVRSQDQVVSVADRLTEKGFVKEVVQP